MFNGCTSLNNVIIPNNVTKIGDYAFNGCNSLTNIHISNSVKAIGKQAFNGCRALNPIIVPDEVLLIGNYAFGGIQNVIYGGNASGRKWEQVTYIILIVICTIIVLTQQ